jgi:hypothetical protein
MECHEVEHHEGTRTIVGRSPEETIGRSLLFSRSRSENVVVDTYLDVTSFHDLPRLTFKL